MSLSVDADFLSFHELQLAIDIWEKENATNLNMRNSQKLEAGA
ncbi:MAG: hypothetical protein ACKE51_02535 [Methylococcaceae bacterium]